MGTRVILAHAYFQVDPAIVRHVVGRDIPVLRTQLSRILERWSDTT